jgi:hypothetical protein
MVLWFLFLVMNVFCLVLDLKTGHPILATLSVFGILICMRNLTKPKDPELNP